MSVIPLQLLLAGEADPSLLEGLRAAGLAVTQAAEATAARAQDAVWLRASSHLALAALARRTDLPKAAFDSAVVVAAGVTDEALEADLLHQGVQAIVPAAEKAAMPRALRHAVSRERVERSAHTA